MGAKWISSSRNCKAQPFGIKWPNKPIKALGIYYTYDQKLLLEKNFIERFDSIKNLTRSLSIYGKIMLIESLLIPKFVCVIFKKGKNNCITTFYIIQDTNRVMADIIPGL